MKTSLLISTAVLLSSFWSASVANAGDYEDPVMDHRFDGIFHIGFGDDANAIGMDARYDRPVHKYVTVGGAFGFFTIGKDGNRNPVMDLSAFIKGRYNYKIGNKKKFEAEAYGLFHIGPTISFDPTDGGFNIGVTPGWQVLITKNLGVLGEMGFIHRQTGKGFSKTKLSQGVLRLGVVVVLP